MIDRSIAEQTAVVISILDWHTLLDSVRSILQESVILPAAIGLHQRIPDSMDNILPGIRPSGTPVEQGAAALEPRRHCRE